MLIIWSPNFVPVVSKMVLKISIFFLEMDIFNAIFDPPGKNWDDQIIYTHF